MYNCISYKYENQHSYDNYCIAKEKNFFLNIEECEHNNGTSSFKYYNITNNSFYLSANKSFNLICENGIKISRSCGTPIYEQNKNVIKVLCNNDQYCLDIDGNNWSTKSSCNSWKEQGYWLSFSFLPSVLLSLVAGIGLFHKKINTAGGELPNKAIIAPMLLAPFSLHYFDDYMLHEKLINYVSFDANKFCEDHSFICSAATIGAFMSVGFLLSGYMPHPGNTFAD